MIIKEFKENPPKPPRINCSERNINGASCEMLEIVSDRKCLSVSVYKRHQIHVMISKFQLQNYVTVDSLSISSPINNETKITFCSGILACSSYEMNC